MERGDGCVWRERVERVGRDVCREMCVEGEDGESGEVCKRDGEMCLERWREMERCV